jgi:hypothetical protein
LPEYRSALRFASGTDEESMDTKELVKFLAKEQGFEDVDEKKAESIIQLYETGDEKKQTLSINGEFFRIRRIWGNFGVCRNLINFGVVLDFTGLLINLLTLR